MGSKASPSPRGQTRWVRSTLLPPSLISTDQRYHTERWGERREALLMHSEARVQTRGPARPPKSKPFSSLIEREELGWRFHDTQTGMPLEYQEAQGAFKDLMIHWILQFTLLMHFTVFFIQWRAKRSVCWSCTSSFTLWRTTCSDGHTRGCVVLWFTRDAGPERAMPWPAQRSQVCERQRWRCGVHDIVTPEGSQLQPTLAFVMILQGVTYETCYNFLLL